MFDHIHFEFYNVCVQITIDDATIAQYMKLLSVTFLNETYTDTAIEMFLRLCSIMLLS